MSSAERLQKEVERFTDKLERERRQGLILDEEVRTARVLLEQKVRESRKTHKLRQGNEREGEKVKEMENALHVVNSQLSALCASNAALRAQIDTHRQSTHAYLSLSEALSQSLLDVSALVETTQTLTSRAQQTQSFLSTRINSFRNSFESEKTPRKLRYASVDLGKGEVRRLKRRTDFSETFQGEIWTGKDVLKLLQTKWARLAASKRAELTSYQSLTSRLKAGFRQILEKERFSDYMQAATVLINTVESHQALRERLAYLREQTDLLKAARMAVQDEIVDLSTSKEVSGFAANSKNSRIKGKLASTAILSQEATEKLHLLREAVKELAAPVDMLRELLELGAGQQEADLSLDSVKCHLSQLEPSLCQLSLPRTKHTHPYPVSHFFITERHSSAPSEVPPANLTALLSTGNSLFITESSRPLKFAEFRLRAQHVVGKLPA